MKFQTLFQIAACLAYAHASPLGQKFGFGFDYGDDDYGDDDCDDDDDQGPSHSYGHHWPLPTDDCDDGPSYSHHWPAHPTEGSGSDDNRQEWAPIVTQQPAVSYVPQQTMMPTTRFDLVTSQQPFTYKTGALATYEKPVTQKSYEWITTVKPVTVQTQQEYVTVKPVTEQVYNDVTTVRDVTGRVPVPYESPQVTWVPVTTVRDVTTEVPVIRPTHVPHHDGHPQTSCCNSLQISSLDPSLNGKFVSVVDGEATICSSPNDSQFCLTPNGALKAEYGYGCLPRESPSPLELTRSDHYHKFADSNGQLIADGSNAWFVCDSDGSKNLYWSPNADPATAHTSTCHCVPVQLNLAQCSA